ncbi:MAG: hypothetical protein PHE51_11310 [Eubacteriales bacterium]|nr:hypothetical protein [Eubacteriales bacterium]
MELDKKEVKRLREHLNKGEYAVLGRTMQENAIHTIECQQREIEQLATALVHTWDDKFCDELVPDHIIQTLDKARAIVHGGD